MSDERERVEHPSWCDRGRCTAPEFRPTVEEFKGKARTGEHVSAVMTLPGYGPGRELQVFVSQAVAPWETGAFLRMKTGDDELSWSSEVGEHGHGFALYELLGSVIGGFMSKYPALYVERFPHLRTMQEEGW